MELNKAIDILKAYRVGGYGTLMDIRVMFEAIDVVLQELDTRYNKGYQDGFKQAEFEVEMDKMQEEMTAEEFLRIRDMECIKYEECDDKCKFKRRGECVALCRIAVQIAKEIKEENNEQV